MLKDFASDVTANLTDILKSLPQLVDKKRRIVLGFSGGQDSSALLKILSRPSVQKDFSVIAAHLNHNMQADSGKWAKHCRFVASQYKLRYIEQSLTGEPQPGQSREAWAREQRYSWFQEIIGAGDLLLTAHHQDDQLETFMLQLIRGAGPHGLGGIRQIRKFGEGFLVRPMLAKTREEVKAYVISEQIPHIEDPSNNSTDFDRNYLRLQVLPSLRNRWPHVSSSVSRASEIQQMLADDLDERSNQFLKAKRSSDGSIAREDLIAVPAKLRFSIIRQWCHMSGVQLLEQRNFSEIEKAVFARMPSPTLSIEWKNATLRYFRGQLYLERREDLFDATVRFSWNLSDSLRLPNGVLEMVSSLGSGIDTKFQRHAAKVGYYQRVGERCHPSSRANSQTLKRLFQEWRVPPWARDKAPIIWIEGTIAAVVPYCICRDFIAAPGTKGMVPKFIVND